MTTVLTTERLRLRPWTTDDVDMLHTIFGDGEAMHFYGGAFAREKTATWIDRQLEAYERDGCGLWCVVSRQDDNFVGQCGVWRHQVAGALEYEIGYHVVRAFWRQGLATEAAQGCRDYAFDALGVERLTSWMTPDNVASRRVAEKTGLGFERDAEHAIVGPMVVYSLAREARPAPA